MKIDFGSVEVTEEVADKLKERIRLAGNFSSVCDDELSEFLQHLCSRFSSPEASEELLHYLGESCVIEGEMKKEMELRLDSLDVTKDQMH